jgi:hypothetical protein
MTSSDHSVLVTLGPGEAKGAPDHPHRGFPLPTPSTATTYGVKRHIWRSPEGVRPRVKYALCPHRSLPPFFFSTFGDTGGRLHGGGIKLALSWPSCGVEGAAVRQLWQENPRRGEQ